MSKVVPNTPRRLGPHAQVVWKSQALPTLVGKLVVRFSVIWSHEKKWLKHCCNCYFSNNRRYLHGSSITSQAHRLCISDLATSLFQHGAPGFMASPWKKPHLDRFHHSYAGYWGLPDNPSTSGGESPNLALLPQGCLVLIHLSNLLVISHHYWKLPFNLFVWFT